MMQIAEEDRASALQVYKALNDSPIQRRLRQEKAWFVGAVYWNPADVTRAELTNELRRMRTVGFNMVRFHNAAPIEIGPGLFDFTRADEWLAAAQEAGLNVLLDAGLGRPGAQNLAANAITWDEFQAADVDDPRLQAVLRQHLGPIITHFRGNPVLQAYMAFGEPHPGERELSTPLAKQQFAAWLKEQYGTLENLDRAWNIYPRKGRTIVPSFEDAWLALGARDLITPDTPGDPSMRRCYGARRDLMRFQTDRGLHYVATVIRIAHEFDPDTPIQTGSHQLLSAQPHLRWDVGRWARQGDQHTSSIHLSWHFEIPGGEVDIPAYLQARLTHDYFKYGWTSAFETTGGAVQYSGGYGNAMTPGLFRRLMLAYLAAGNQSIAFWTWNHRPGGWEAGEYGLTTLSGAVSRWALEAGKLAHGMEKYIAELWEANARPQVGLLTSWDNEAVYELEPERHEMTQAGPHDYTSGTRQQPSRALIGAARALTNAHVPFEYVTADEILAGIAPVYPVIYAPHLRAASLELIGKLHDYVEKGGVLIGDVQFGFEDPWGKLHRSGPGGVVDATFGAYVDTIQDARTAAPHLNGLAVEGFYGDLVISRAHILANFDNGLPAVTEHLLGAGRAVLLAYDAGMTCFMPGARAWEELLVNLLCGDWRPGWKCDAPLAFRLSAQAADHYFLLNPGPARTVFIRAYDCAYQSGEMVLESQPVEVAGSLAITIPADSAVWVRFEKE